LLAHLYNKGAICGITAMGLLKASVLGLLSTVDALSRPCSESFNHMLADENYKYMNKTFQQWCRVRVENKLAGCCELVDFAKGKADLCVDKCEVSCEHTPMHQICNKHFGTACKVKRAPFFTNVSTFEVTETFCLPQQCVNKDDVSSFLLHYHIYYLSTRYQQWQKDYEHGELVCPDDTEMLVLIIVSTVVGFALLVWAICYLRRPPPQKGQTMIEANPRK